MKILLGTTLVAYDNEGFHVFTETVDGGKWIHPESFASEHDAAKLCANVIVRGEIDTMHWSYLGAVAGSTRARHDAEVAEQFQFEQDCLTGEFVYR